MHERVEHAEERRREMRRAAPPVPSAPARLLALQRAGVSNHAMARVLAREPGDENDEAEAETPEGSGAAPLLLLDRPWWPVLDPPPLPLAQPAFDFDLPIIIPRAAVPPAWRWLFGLPPVEPIAEAPLAIEYKPLVPEEEEQEEPPAQEEEEAQPKAKRKKRKKKKKPAQTEGTTQATPTAPPPPPQAQPAQDLDDVVAFILGPQKDKAPKAKTQTQTPKLTEAQKRHNKEMQARQQKKAAEAEKHEKLEKERIQAEKLAETKLRAGLIARLGGLKTRLTDARDELPDEDAYNDIYDEANNGLTDLTTYLAGPATTANSTTLTAKAEEYDKLVSKVNGFKPPLTEEQRREKKRQEIITNVPVLLSQAKWEGPFGGETSFGVDKNDQEMREWIRGYFGRDTIEVEGHENKSYPKKTETSKVYYYVTGTSKTKYIAYDITLHAFEGDDSLGTVHVLHIPHRT